MTGAYVHGYDPRENLRLQDQASTLVELLHSRPKRRSRKPKKRLKRRGSVT